jgi:hypothetical protein
LIVAVVSDLLLEVRIDAAAQLQGVAVKTVSPDEASGVILRTRPSLVVADLAVAGLDLVGLATSARQANASVVGFHPHVDVNLRRSAQNAGIEFVYPRSRFLRDLPKIITERLQS